MCHELPLAEPLAVRPQTLPAADLLMTKLQIVELNAKDRGDLYALLASHDVSTDASDDAGAIDVGADRRADRATTGACSTRSSSTSGGCATALAEQPLAAERAAARRRRIDALAGRSRRRRRAAGGSSARGRRAQALVRGAGGGRPRLRPHRSDQTKESSATEVEPIPGAEYAQRRERLRELAAERGLDGAARRQPRRQRRRLGRRHRLPDQPLLGVPADPRTARASGRGAATPALVMPADEDGTLVVEIPDWRDGSRRDRRRPCRARPVGGPRRRRCAIAGWPRPGRADRPREPAARHRRSDPRGAARHAAVVGRRPDRGHAADQVRRARSR